MSEKVKFLNSWKKKDISLNHCTYDCPKNQVQFAFRQNYKTFKQLVRGKISDAKILEVGCGRGTMSNYFALEGANCFMVDYSKNAINIAKKNFDKSFCDGNFICGDVFSLPFKNNEFDLVFSFGLLEHFESKDVELIIDEQMRVLKSGGSFIHYVVPKSCRIQKLFNPANSALSLLLKKDKKKEKIFINNIKCEHYVDTIKNRNCNSISYFGVYPLPMISHSIRFPFSTMPTWFEKILVSIFSFIIKIRERRTRFAWRCSVDFGQAFIICGIKL